MLSSCMHEGGALICQKELINQISVKKLKSTDFVPEWHQRLVIL